jgi:uncharacterized protein (TIGR02118 family)
MPTSDQSDTQVLEHVLEQWALAWSSSDAETRRRDQTREQCLQLWSGERHIGIVRKVPSLTKWVQNHVVSAPGEPACDGIGELWFESDEAMTEALNSAEMAAAVEDAKNFLDMEKTGMVIVQEQSVVG